ncbi:MAG: outer-membrane lipoprotein carrier protein LolA [Anaplasmataceae bacterium]|nr:outer-membrane lipoprotein carrier protein LolA [Anaplasmataceae bacterium]
MQKLFVIFLFFIGILTNNSYADNIDKIIKFTCSLKSIQGNINQYDYQTKETISGKIYAKSPDKFRIDYDKKKLPISIYSNGKNIIQYDWDLNEKSNFGGKSLITPLFYCQSKHDDYYTIIENQKYGRNLYINDSLLKFEFVINPNINIDTINVISKDGKKIDIRMSFHDLKINESIPNDIFKKIKWK